MRGEKAEAAVFLCLCGVSALIGFGFLFTRIAGSRTRPMSPGEARAMEAEAGSTKELDPIAASWTGSWKVARVKTSLPNGPWRSLEIKKLDHQSEEFYQAAPDLGPAWIIKAKSEEDLHLAIAWMVNQKSEGGTGE